MSDNPWNDPESNATNKPLPAGAPAAGKADPAAPARDEQKAWKLVEKLVLGLGQEQRRARRWGIFFKSLTFIYLFVALFLLVPKTWWSGEVSKTQPHTALVDIKGMIAEGEEASADNIVGALRRAFKDGNTKGVILRINSPGGSPVQAGYIYDEIRRLREKHPETKLYSVITDLGASGGYYVAAASDEIYADKASLVGSIGVISSSFGFAEVLDKLGIERRILAAGEHKAFLDPFVPLKESERRFWEEVLETTHQQFITQVRRGRGERLKDSEELFSGLVWSGEQALELGLIDGLGSAGHVAREVIGVEHIVSFSPQLSPLERWAEKLGVSFGRALLTEVSAQQYQLR